MLKRTGGAVNEMSYGTHRRSSLSLGDRALRLFVTVALLSILGWGGSPLALQAQEPSPEETSEEPADTSAQQSLSQRILSKMHQVNQMEMQAGQLAWKTGSTEALRNYGERLFRDHRYADRKVTQLAEEKGFELQRPDPKSSSAKMMRKMKKMLKKLKKAQGAQFDQLFLKMMVQGHKKMIQTLSQAAQKLATNEVRELVTDVIPILEQHLTLAQRLQSSP